MPDARRVGDSRCTEAKRGGKGTKRCQIHTVEFPGKLADFTRPFFLAWPLRFEKLPWSLCCVDGVSRQGSQAPGKDGLSPATVVYRPRYILLLL